MKLSDTQCNYTPLPGSVPIEEDVFCGVCGDKMTEERGLVGPTSSVESMSGGSHLHDWFSCPCSEEKWHKQVIALREEAKKTPSQTLATMFLVEANDILNFRTSTKNWHP